MLSLLSVSGKHIRNNFPFIVMQKKTMSTLGAFLMIAIKTEKNTV